MAHTRAERRWFRYVKGMRRLKADRQEHSPYGTKTLEETCDCFAPKESKAFGKIFSRFADTPKPCSCISCGNKRHLEGPTIQERRADDQWDDINRQDTYVYCEF
jgi:hypothetical protein